MPKVNFKYDIDDTVETNTGDKGEVQEMTVRLRQGQKVKQYFLNHNNGTGWFGEDETDTPGIVGKAKATDE